MKLKYATDCTSYYDHSMHLDSIYSDVLLLYKVQTHAHIVQVLFSIPPYIKNTVNITKN